MGSKPLDYWCLVLCSGSLFADDDVVFIFIFVFAVDRQRFHSAVRLDSSWSRLSTLICISPSTRVAKSAVRSRSRCPCLNDLTCISLSSWDCLGNSFFFFVLSVRGGVLQ